MFYIFYIQIPPSFEISLKSFLIRISKHFRIPVDVVMHDNTKYLMTFDFFIYFVKFPVDYFKMSSKVLTI